MYAIGPQPELTNQMRHWLGRWEVILFYDFCLQFMREFGLDPHSAGRLIAQWIVETMPSVAHPPAPLATKEEETKL